MLSSEHYISQLSYIDPPLRDLTGFSLNQKARQSRKALLMALFCPLLKEVLNRPLKNFLLLCQLKNIAKKS